GPGGRREPAVPGRRRGQPPRRPETPLDLREGLLPAVQPRLPAGRRLQPTSSPCDRMRVLVLLARELRPQGVERRLVAGGRRIGPVQRARTLLEPLAPVEQLVEL